MFGLFKKKHVIPLQQWVLDHPEREKDKIFQLAKMLITYSAAFIPLKPKMKPEYVQRFYNDKTIIELAIFLLFHLDFYLFVNSDRNREEKINKAIGFYLHVFNQIEPAVNFQELITDRLYFYGSKANNNKNVITDTTDLMHSLIIETQDFKKFTLHREDDFIPLSLDLLNNSIFKSHITNYFLGDVKENVFSLYKEALG